MQAYYQRELVLAKENLRRIHEGRVGPPEAQKINERLWHTANRRTFRPSADEVLHSTFTYFQAYQELFGNRQTVAAAAE